MSHNYNISRQGGICKEKLCGHDFFLEAEKKPIRGNSDKLGGEQGREGFLRFYFHLFHLVFQHLLEGDEIPF